MLTFRLFDVVEEPHGKVLSDLFRSAARLSHRLMMVVPDESNLSLRGRLFLAKIEPFLIRRRSASAWPGTVLLDSEATIFEYVSNIELIEIVLIQAERLYDWVEPELPEDIAFLRDDGTEVLGSISHERDAYMRLTADEYEAIAKSSPLILSIIKFRPE